MAIGHHRFRTEASGTDEWRIFAVDGMTYSSKCGKQESCKNIIQAIIVRIRIANSQVYYNTDQSLKHAWN